MRINKRNILLKYILSITEVDVIIYFDNNADLIKKWILFPIGLKTVVVRNPSEIIINLRIIFCLIKNIKLIFGNNLIKRARYVYEKSLIKVYNPKVVITIIDNSNFISELSKIDKERSYFSIQNGTRFDFDINSIGNSVFNDLDKKSFTYFSWGDYEKTVINKYSDFKCHFKAVGSFRQSICSFYPTKLTELKNNKFDICMVSTAFYMKNGDIARAIHGDLVVDNEWTEYNICIAKYLNKYIKDNGKTLIVALRSNSKDEIDLYESIFNGTDNVFIMPRIANDNNNNMNPYFNTYSAVNNSQVIVSMASGITLESTGIGKKILQCDFSMGKQYFTNYVNGLWQLNENNYKVFSNRLNIIFQLDIDYYNKIINKYKNYVMKYDIYEPTYVKIQKEIKDQLECLVSCT
jgi:surface carbohydrate biosynthesis protein